ncbi:MAG: AraC family transcriptional regulator [Myxococcota bacterium]
MEVHAAHRSRIDRVMEHVRGHLEHDLSLPQLAKVAGRSPFHFHRLFKAIAGETLTTFVQRARLERAAYLMMTSPNRRLDSIALEVGFGGHSDFSRVFKKHYSLAPSEWDRRSRLDSVSVVEDYERIVSEARSAQAPPELRVLEQPARTLLAVRVRAPFIGKPVQEGYQRLVRAMEDRAIDWRRRVLVGWSWDNYETTPLEKVHCCLGFVVEESEAVGDEGVFVERFPRHQAVQARCNGPMLDIAVAWDVLYDEWLPVSAYETDNLPGTKLFVRRPDETGWEHFDVWCSLAIRPAME